MSLGIIVLLDDGAEGIAWAVAWGSIAAYLLLALLAFRRVSAIGQLSAEPVPESAI